ncbi:Flp family type IVb pilin [Enterobacteriaceae bacterium 4M9]|nr:Flp family type IVb pilin [Enterobacteriaceae bacterium 4M9]
MILKACATIHTNIATARRAENEAGITAIEYAIIGVAMASGLFFIFDEGGFLKSLQMAWQTMGTKIISAGNILN